MKLREHCTAKQLRAHAILDAVRDGILHSLDDIRWALRVLGEPVDMR